MRQHKYSDWQREQMFQLREQGLSYKEINEELKLGMTHVAGISTQLKLRMQRILKGVFDPYDDLDVEKPEPEEVPDPIPSVPHSNELSEYELLNNYEKHYPKRKRK